MTAQNSKNLSPATTASRIMPLVLLMLASTAQAQFNYVTNTDGTITIAHYAGSGGAVTIPGMIDGRTVVSIGSNAFNLCSSLTSVTIPNSVTSIEDGAFSGCHSLTSVTIPNSVTSIKDGTFSGCWSLANITIPNSVNSIGYHAFYTCLCLTNVTIPDSVTSIGDGAFDYCDRLPNVTIPDSVTNIGSMAFFYCSRLVAITVDTNNPAYSSAGGVLFNKSQTALIQCPQAKAGDYTVPDTVTSIGSWAFAFCEHLTSVTIPDSVTSIGDRAFNCSSLTNVTVPNRLASIGNGTFNSCSSLTSVTIPDSVTSIGDEAFRYCTSLTSVTIPDSVTNIGRAFVGDCSRLNAITVDTNNPAYSSVDGVLFNKSQTALIQCPQAKAGAYIIPDRVTSIGNGAFYFCIGLTNVIISNSVTNINNGAFYGCHGLTSVTIPNRLTKIGDQVFYACSKLTSVTIPNSVTSIEHEAFSGCSSLKGVYFLGDAPEIGSSVFEDDFDAIIYYLPGTTNWVSTFGECPALLWNPTLRGNTPDFGVRTNRFGFTITGTINIPILIEGCTNLATGPWEPRQSLNLTNGSYYFSDPDWTNYPARFYRIRSP